jgi:rubredoxin
MRRSTKLVKKLGYEPEEIPAWLYRCASCGFLLGPRIWERIKLDLTCPNCGDSHVSDFEMVAWYTASEVREIRGADE